MSERDDMPRDVERAGDVGDGSHSAFAADRDGEPRGNDERLGMRGRSTAPDESAFLDELDAARATREAEGGTRDADR
jgi:hypothetical protein